MVRQQKLLNTISKSSASQSAHDFHDSNEEGSPSSSATRDRTSVLAFHLRNLRSVQSSLSNNPSAMLIHMAADLKKLDGVLKEVEGADARLEKPWVEDFFERGLNLKRSMAKKDRQITSLE
jgi:hypothetical protein